MVQGLALSGIVLTKLLLATIPSSSNDNTGAPGGCLKTVVPVEPALGATREALGLFESSFFLEPALCVAHGAGSILAAPANLIAATAEP